MNQVNQNEMRINCEDGAMYSNWLHVRRVLVHVYNNMIAEYRHYGINTNATNSFVSINIATQHVRILMELFIRFVCSLN